MFDGTRKGFADCANKNIKWPYKHILQPDLSIAKNGLKLSGFHHDLGLAIEKSGLMKITDKVVGPHGFYQAKVWCNGLSTPKTFFPSHWTREQVMGKIIEAYDNFIAAGAKNFILEPSGKYFVKAFTNEGIEIGMYFTKLGEMLTVYPKL